MLNYKNFLKRERNIKEGVNYEMINEDLNKSRKFLKDMHIVNTVANELDLIQGDLRNQLLNKERRIVQLKDFSEEDQRKIIDKAKTIKLDKAQLKELEKTEEFMEIRKMCEKKLGYLYMFVYFYYAENVEMGSEGDENNPNGVGLKGLYKRVIDNNDLINMLPKMDNVGKRFDASFIDETLPNESESRTNNEILTDGLDSLDSYRKVKKVLDQLPRKMRDQYKKASTKIKNELLNIAIGFDNVPTDEDPKLKDKVWRNFFGEMRVDMYEFLENGAPNPSFGKKRFMSKLGRYLKAPDPLLATIEAAKDTLKSFDVGYVDLIDRITETNDKFGKSGVNVVFDLNGVVIVDVLSFSANNYLNRHLASAHCIVYGEGYWNSHVGNTNNKQYYVYDTNISSVDPLSVIGTTIEPGQRVRTTHDKRDTYISTSSFKDLLKKMEKEYDIPDELDLFSFLKPMTEEEIIFREKIKEANARIVEKGLSLEKMREYVEEFGADVNKDNAVALKYAVQDGDIEKVTYLLDHGADPNLEKDERKRAISFAGEINMLSLLIERGAQMTEQVFINVISSDEDESLKLCLDAGMSPNMSNNRPLREVIKGSFKAGASFNNPTAMGQSYFTKFKLLIDADVDLVNDKGIIIVLHHAIAFNRKEIIDYCIERNLIKKWDKEQILSRAINTWVMRNRKLSPDQKNEWVHYLENLASMI